MTSRRASTADTKMCKRLRYFESYSYAFELQFFCSWTKNLVFNKVGASPTVRSGLLIMTVAHHTFVACLCIPMHAYGLQRSFDFKIVKWNINNLIWFLPCKKDVINFSHWPDLKTGGHGITAASDSGRDGRRNFSALQTTQKRAK